MKCAFKRSVWGLFSRLGMCQSPRSLTALFQLTAGLSPATGEHAGKWVTVVVCFAHICSTVTLSLPRKRMTSQQRLSVSTGGAAVRKQETSLRLFLPSQGAAR